MERAIEILKQQKEGLEWVVNNIQDAEESKLTLTDVNKALQLLQTDVIKSVCPKCDSEDWDGIGQYRRCNKCNERWKQTVL